ncbi:MAG: LysE family translocator [Verrucomicrobiales bacterium]|nr:hypothetical protein [Verrucomicrobiales bacterium]OUU84849.1 MAG: hypothetical protein CBC36_11670 [Verrucomicrobiaceae bacterium TMED76]RCL33971.1 MAG: hypothetical protein DBX02_00315 [Verrucomicrobiota bacterium]|tara:strand:+ start:1051 stop:1638 length:588 start_codon:yes stop_codon:yes gene_type:complete
MLAGQFTPGPDFILVLKIALNDGKKAGAFASLGISIGLLIHCSIAMTGLAVLLDTSTELGKAIKLLGSAYLIYLALNLLRIDRQKFLNTRNVTENSKSNGTASVAFFQGFLTNILNPKVIIFISAILSGFISSNSTFNEKLIYGLIIVLQGGVFWFLFSCLLQGKAIKALFLNHQRFFNRLFALLLILVAIAANI